MGSFFTRFASALCLGGALFLLAGCVGDATGGESAQDGQDPDGSATLPAKNADRWTLPLDPFVLSDEDLGKQSYATALLVEDCVSSKDVDVVPVPYVDFDAAYENGAHERYTLTRAQALELGYHHPVEVSPAGLAAWNEYRGASRSDAELEAADECVQEFDGALPGYDNEALNFASDFVQAAYQGAVSSSEVVEAAEGWAECMAPQGIEDLPADPQNMPSESIRQQYATSGGRDGETLGPITQAEIDLALADMDCRESSGYQQALYDAIWEREARLLEENQAAFEEQRAAIEATDAEIERVIAEHATGGGSS